MEEIRLVRFLASSVAGFASTTATKLSLQVNHLKVAAGRKAKCTLLMTSCYSGGWAMNPDLNLTIIAVVPMAR
jgi:hypothetical protein